MGEAWFMGETRRMYTELLGDLDEVEPDALFDALEAIASGPTCFGQHEEWTEWYHYLLPNLVLGSHAGPVWTSGLEVLATAFFAQHPDSGAAEPHPGFRTDVLLTLGRALMVPDCWPSGNLDVDGCLGKSYLPGAGRWLWDQPSAKLSCSMFLHLKYLSPPEIARWLTSAFAIRSAHWRAQLLAWFVGAHPFLTGVLNQPGEEREDAWPGTQWWSSHCLKGSYSGDFSGSYEDVVFLPPAQRNAGLSAVRQFASRQYVDVWTTEFEIDGVLAAEMGVVPDKFLELYSRS
jgi:hypothetical protein